MKPSEWRALVRNGAEVANKYSALDEQGKVYAERLAMTPEERECYDAWAESEAADRDAPFAADERNGYRS